MSRSRTAPARVVRSSVSTWFFIGIALFSLGIPWGAAAGGGAITPSNLPLTQGGTTASQDIQDNRFFVEQQYRDFLAREGEEAGINFWVESLETGRVTRADLVEEFFLSHEFQSSIAPVARLYFAYFDRIPDYAGLQFWVGELQGGRSLADMSQAFAASPEFIATYGNLDDGEFVDLVYWNVLGRAPEPEGRAFWMGELAAGMSRGELMVRFSESEEYRALSFNAVQVTMMYVSMLRRAPEQEGFDFWVGELEAGRSILGLIEGFLVSPEYVGRFSGGDSSFTVTAIAGSGGGIQPPTQVVSAGDATMFTVSPDPGFAIRSVTGCGGSLSGDLYTTGPITQACTVNASFDLLDDGLIQGRYEVIGSDGGIVRDVVTGLEWMRCSQGQVWFDNQCVGDASTFTFDGAKERAATFNGSGGFGGHTDWRVPNVSDLRSLVYCSNTGQFGVHDWGCGASTGDYDSPTIAQAAFPNTPPSTFWSASRYAAPSVLAWVVRFGDGGSQWAGQSINFPIRLARGGQFWPFEIAITGTGSGQVLDLETNDLCDSDCNLSVREGVVSLRAFPDGGSRFEGWGGACGGTDTLCEVAVEQATSVIAEFSTIVTTIEFVTFGGSTVEPIENDYGATVTLPEPRPTRNDDIFIEWNTMADGTGTGYRAGAKIGPLTQNLDLYAQWGVLHAPVNVEVIPLDKAVYLAWDPVPGVDHYEVYVSTTPQIRMDVPDSYQRTIPELVAPLAWITELLNETTYYFVVTAHYEDRASPPSQEVSGTSVSDRAVVMPLNDTGIDWCADESANLLDCPVASHPGQDGDFGRDALARTGQLTKIGGGDAGFDYTKLDANGQPLIVQNMPWSDGGNETDGNRWSCVRDNHTGLVWEVKVNESSDLHYHGHSYTWYDPDSPDGVPGTQDGGVCTGSACDTNGFVQAVNAQGLCGSNDWRMPTRLELHGIVNYGRYNPAINIEYFPNTPTRLFLTGSPRALPSVNGAAWYVDFRHGYASDLPKGDRINEPRVRLVRGGQ